MERRQGQSQRGDQLDHWNATEASRRYSSLRWRARSRCTSRKVLPGSTASARRESSMARSMAARFFSRIRYGVRSQLRPMAGQKLLQLGELVGLGGIGPVVRRCELPGGGLDRRDVRADLARRGAPCRSQVGS